MTQLYKENCFDSLRSHRIKVELSNGDTIKANITATVDQVVDLYIGKKINLGYGGKDVFAHGAKIWFYDGEGYAMQHHKTHILINKGSFHYVVDHGDQLGLEVFSAKHNGSKWFLDDRREQLLALGDDTQKWKRFIEREF